MTSSWQSIWLLPGGRRRLNRRLFRAAGCGDTAQVELLLNQGADVNADDGWATVLGWAGRSPNGNAATVLFLLTQGARANGNPKRRTINPFLQASHSSDDDIIRLFVEHGADVNALEERVASTGCTALQELIGWANTDTIEFVLDQGADIHKRGLGRQGTPLHFAASWGRLDVVKLLLERGADVMARDRLERTALGWAEGMLVQPHYQNFSASPLGMRLHEVIPVLKDAMERAA